MKWSKTGLITVFMLCAVTAFAAETVPLEQAIDEAAATFSARIKPGSTIVVVGISSDNNELSEFISDELSYKIYSLNKLKVAERKSLDAIKKEMNFQLSGEVSDDTIKQIGNMTGASTVIVGTFKNQRSHYLLTVKALNVSTAIVEAMHRTQVAQSETIINAIGKLDKTPSSHPPLAKGARYTGGQRFVIGMKNHFAFGLGSYQAGYIGDGIGLTVTHVIGNALFWGGVFGEISQDDRAGGPGPIIALSLGVFIEFGAFLYGCIVPIWYEPPQTKIGSIIKNINVDLVANNSGALIPRLGYKIDY